MREERSRYRNAKSLNSGKRKLISRYSHEPAIEREGEKGGGGSAQLWEGNYVTESKLVSEAVPRLGAQQRYRWNSRFPI